MAAEPEYRIVGSDRVPVDTLTPHPNNARKGDLGLLMRSLRQYGQFRRIVVNRHSGFITMGNHTWMAARQLGWKEVDVDYIDEPDETRELEMVLIDNRATDLAAWDDVMLEAQLRQLDDAEHVGWADEDLRQLEARLGVVEQADRAAARVLDEADRMTSATQEPPPETDEDEPPPAAPTEGNRGLGQPVISYQIVFDDEDQKRLWVEFLKWLRANIDGETTGERLAQYIDSQGITA